MKNSANAGREARSPFLSSSTFRSYHVADMEGRSSRRFDRNVRGGQRDAQTHREEAFLRMSRADWPADYLAHVHTIYSLRWIRESTDCPSGGATCHRCPGDVP